MSRNYESILDHIAEYLRFLSNTQSFLFILNTSYHCCHLANQFCLGPNEYKVLLIVAGLAFYKTGFGFVIKPMAWKNFFWVIVLQATIVQSNSNKRRLTSMPTLMGHHHLDLKEGSSTSLGLGIPPSN
jgi:hypothetical protein